MFGKQIENLIGPKIFLPAYLLCGVAAMYAHYLSEPSSIVPCVGASGAISGVVGAFFILFPRSRFDLDVYFGYWRIKTFKTNARVAIGTWFLEQFLLGLITRKTHFSTVAFWAHVGGFAAGVLIAGVYMLQGRALPQQKTSLDEGGHGLHSYSDSYNDPISAEKEEGADGKSAPSYRLFE